MRVGGSVPEAIYVGDNVVVAYYLNLFSPATYEAFSRSDRTVSGFQEKHQALARRVKPGDSLLCYVTKLSRWAGALEVVDGPFVDRTPIYAPDDPFIVRFHVTPEIWLPMEQAIPIKEDELWTTLSFTRGYDKGSSAWAQRVKGSLGTIADEDAAVILGALRRQVHGGATYPVDPGGVSAAYYARRPSGGQGRDRDGSDDVHRSPYRS